MGTQSELRHGRIRMGKGVGISAALFLLFALAVHAALSWSDTIKITPLSVSVTPASSLPPEVQTLETQTINLLFDRDTNTSYTPYGASQAIITLENSTEVRALKIYGAAPVSMNVYSDQSGSWQTVTGLQNINLTASPARWNRFEPAAPITTTRLRLDFTPATSSAAAGIYEIEILGAGQRIVLAGSQNVLTQATSTTPPPQTRVYTATPAQGVIGAASGAVDDLSDNRFSFTLNRTPTDFKRVYLAYDLYSLTHWSSAVRSIDGKPVQGNHLLPIADAWSTQIEPINPTWLSVGTNTVEFSQGSAFAAPYTVKNVRIVTELSNGANFIRSVESNQLDTGNNPATVIDGDTATGWTVFPTGNVVRANTPTLAFSFDKPTQLSAVMLSLSNTLKGTVTAQFKQNGVWSESGIAAISGSKLTSGWNTLNIASSTAIDGVQLSFNNPNGSSAIIMEVAPIGSGVGHTYGAPHIEISYPDAGQFYGRSAYIRGYAQPADNGSGLAQLTVGGKPVTQTDGAFGVDISKDDLGLSAQGDAEAWSVEVKATYPDGAIAATVVQLNQYNAAVESTANQLLPTYAQLLSPGQAKKLAYDGASVDIGIDALAFYTTIGMTPLKDEDLPALDQGMTNVTKGPRRGYRFTPHPMKFKSKIKVQLPYNKALIPPGLTEQDIKTFYFDEAAGTWQELERVSVDTQGNTITSYTDHFTDMINATITVPDHPNPASFNPTSMKDIKAADPGSQINLIEPPKANNNGDARLSYPIEIPPGRHGMQPQLAVQYNSGGGNSWMGMGWDMPMQAITIDTRWGVPRYDANQETETYLLNGEQLTPVAHRGLVARKAEKQFHTRVEGRFQYIVRHGNSPKNYWWEVTDKNGTRFSYGGVGSVDTNTALTDGSGNVFVWSLSEVRDTNNNFVKYRYAHVSDTGVANGTVAGDQLYLQSASYTGFGVQEGAYVVTLVRDRDLGETLRADKQIDARGGFKRVTADLLRNIDVSFNGQSIRSYEFRYNEKPYGDDRVGRAFEKTLLTAIVQKDAKGSEFNRHTLTYNDEARNSDGSYRGFAAAADWTIGNDNVSANLLGKGGASALGGSKGSNTGGHFYVGFGAYDGLLYAKTNTIGAKIGYSRGTNETLLALADMNGDSLPDKVFKSDSGFYYRPNLSGPTGTASFGAPVAIPSLPLIGREKVTSTTFGVESLFSGVSALIDRNKAETETNAYFSDVNGDGLTDLVSGGQVLFGYLNSAGVPTFTANSAITPVPIGGGAVDTDGLLEDASAIVAERAQNFPLLDTLRRWVAPYDGVINIDAPVRLIQDASTARAEYTGADGVRVAIQLEGAELWSTAIAADNYSIHTPTGVASVPVSRGDRLYFRVQSIFDGAYDQVAWSPQISYLSVDTSRTDVNDLPEYAYSASGDFTLAGRSGSVIAPLTGTLHLGGTLEKATTTDDITLQVIRNGAVAYTQTLSFGTATVVNLSQDIAVNQLDTFEWRISVDSPIDATRVKFAPIAYYTAANGVDSVLDDKGAYVLQINPSYDMDLYPLSALVAPQEFYTVPSSTGSPLAVQARLQVTGLASGDVANAVLTVKRRGVLLAKQPITITGTGASSVDVVVTSSAAVVAGDQLYFDLSSRNPSLGSKISFLEVRVGIDADADGLLDTIVPSAWHTPSSEALFPQPYRGWGAAGYNGNSPRDTQAIDQSLLVVTSSYDPENAKVYPFAPRISGQLWGGVDDQAWVKAGEASASRLGLDDIRVPTASSFAGAAAVPRYSRSNSTSASGGFGPFSGGGSRGSSKSLLDFVDLNGDRFPDVVGQGGVQYSPMVGGLEATKRGGVLDAARSNSNESVNLGVNGSVSVAIGNGKANVVPSGQVTSQTGKQGSDMPSLGFGGNLGSGKSDAEYDLTDINGDGLPDRVYKNGTAALNLGYSFASAEPWNAGILNHGESESLGANIGFNIFSYSIAGGLNLETGRSRSDETYADINGDGLVDKIIGGNPLQVRLNTGAGFTSAINWPGGHGKVAVDTHISLGGGVYFTYCIPLVPPVVVSKLCFNPGINTSTNMGRPEVAFRDVDGDGYADQVFSEKDNEFKVALNPIGRTNLLKSVQRPMGARIDIQYTRDGNTYQMPQSRWLMTTVTVNDGHPGDGIDTQTMTYRYESPHYDRLEREFYGYAKVSEEQRDGTNAVYRSVVREYRTDSFYTKGLEKRELTLDGGSRPFVETENSYVVRDVDTGAAPADIGSTVATLFPQLTRTDRRFYEGQTTPGKFTYTTHQYDSVGNITQFTDAGDVGAQDDVVATIAYSTNCPNYIVGMPTSITVNGNGTMMRKREASVNCATGNVDEVRQYLANNQAAVTKLIYEANGNLATVTGPTNKNGQSYVLSYNYDTIVQTHIAGIRDSFGYNSSADYDFRFGKVTNTTDTNSQKTTYRYDDLGRTTNIVGPYEQGTNLNTLSFAYHPEAIVPWALTKHLDTYRDVADTIDTVLFTDGLKRVLQTKKDATVHISPDAGTQDVMIVSGSVTFDAFGRTIAQRYPTTEPLGNPGVFNTAIDGIDATVTAYDVLDRTVKTTLPDHTSVAMNYGFAPDRNGINQFATQVIDANGKQKNTYRDVRDLITSVQEFNQGATLWTSYAYDPLKQIVQVQDDKNNTTTVAYDNLGRRTIIDNPDVGKTETQYDLASNVIAKITANLAAKGQAINYDYDYTRLKSITYPNYPGNNIAYTYGSPSLTGDTNGNQASRITKIQSQAGTEERRYGRLGEITRETKTIASATQGNSVNSPEIYTTQYLFDTFGRLQQLTYPDNEILTYRYDSGGNLKSAQGQKNNYTYSYLNRLEYDPFEQRAFIEAGNNIRTRYTYNAQNRRLINLNAGKGGNAFQNLNYGYDPVGNITTLANDISVPPPSQYGGPTAQSFKYDDLYRLTHAEGTYQFNPNKTRTYGLDLAYDTIHNIQSKQQTDVITQPSGTPIAQKKTSYLFNYAYAPSGTNSVHPHAPNHIGERTYTYDANGNQLGWDNDTNGTRRTILWDDENRIQSLFDNGHEKTYLYDDAGQRVIKRGPQGETAYVNQWFTIRNREIGTKHIYAGTTRLVSKLMKQDKPGANPNGNTPLEKDLYFYHPDHLGSTGYVTDTNGKLYEHVEYFPFGETWVEEASNTQRTPYLFTGKELDEETGLYYYGARYYDPRTSVWQSGDPAFDSYLSGTGAATRQFGVHLPANLSLYGYSWNSPVVMHDPDGREPVVAQVGTAAQVRATLDNSPSKVGLTTGSSATQALLKFGQTEWSWKGPKPTTGFFNTKSDRYVYTQKGGWIDMSHFMFYAAKGLEHQQEGGNGRIGPVGRTINDGMQQELADTLFAPHSAYSYEDLPSDRYGAIFGAKVFNPNSKQTLGEQIEGYLNKVGATTPSQAPNYKNLPANDAAVRKTGKPTVENKSVTPLYNTLPAE